MKKKMLIEVRKDNKVIETIKRIPFNLGFMGNFVPHWVRYKSNEYLLKGGIDSSYIQEWDNKGYIEV